MTRKDYWREYHAKNRDKRREQMMARYFATGGHKGRLIREQRIQLVADLESDGADKDTAA